MKNYFMFFIVALLATMTFAFTSCGDETEPESEEEVELDYTVEASGSLTIYNPDGDVMQIRQVEDAGFLIHDEDPILSFMVILKDGGDPYELSFVSINDNMLHYVTSGIHIQKVEIGELLDVGDVKVNHFYQKNKEWWLDYARGYFRGSVSIVDFSTNYITLKFTDCEIEVSGKKLGYFSGEVKCGMRRMSFFER